MKNIAAVLIAFTPGSSWLRAILYRIFLGYAIGPGCRVGFGTVIRVKKFTLKKQVRIGRFNIFSGPGDVFFDENAIVGSANKFLCGAWASAKDVFAKKFFAGNSTRITDGHYVDFTGNFHLGDRSWIAGYQSQFWTHGAAKQEKTFITIGNDCYIGSAVRMCPGSKIDEKCTVGIGSVITKEISGMGLTIVGVPAKSLTQNP